MRNRSWTVSATVDGVQQGTRGVVTAVGGSDAGWSLYFDGQGRPNFTYKLFDMKTVNLAGSTPLAGGKHVLTVDFDYDGGGYAKGGKLTFSIDGKPIANDRLPMSPAMFFSIIEAFDVGIDTGSASARYPDGAAVGYPFAGGKIDRVDIKLR